MEKRKRYFIRMLIGALFLVMSVLSGCVSANNADSIKNTTIAVETTTATKDGLNRSALTENPFQEERSTSNIENNPKEIVTSTQPVETSTSVMEVHFLDVGQGDCTLIKSGDSYMLIDAGDNSKGTLVQNYLQKQGISKLDYLVLTHPDADHIGGADVIVTKFDIDTIWMSNYTKDNRTFDNLIQALKYKSYQYSTPAVGSTYQLGDATITVLAPNREYNDPNNASIALLIQNGSNKFLFTGDAEEDAEKDILSNGIELQADVYKVGHHGSKTSTSEDFFNTVKPTYAVISCVEGNTYGHPHAQTMNTLRMNNVKVYRTDESGTIIAKSDGINILFDVPASESWKAGEPTGSSAAAESNSDIAEVAATNAIETVEAPTTSKETAQAAVKNELSYVLNSKTKKFHKSSCSSLPTTNRVDSSKSRDEIVASGYVACKKCNP